MPQPSPWSSPLPNVVARRLGTGIESLLRRGAAAVGATIVYADSRFRGSRGRGESAALLVPPPSRAVLSAHSHEAGPPRRSLRGRWRRLAFLRCRCRCCCCRLLRVCRCNRHRCRLSERDPRSLDCSLPPIVQGCAAPLPVQHHFLTPHHCDDALEDFFRRGMMYRRRARCSLGASTSFPTESSTPSRPVRSSRRTRRRRTSNHRRCMHHLGTLDASFEAGLESSRPRPRGRQSRCFCNINTTVLLG